jgi:uncharacterized damage-inducible protein DinB
MSETGSSVEIERILDQMDRAFSGDAWHGPPLLELLEGVLAEDASKHPVKNAHSIWELAHHIGAWNSIVHRRLEGEVVEVTPEQNWPPVWEASEVEWKRALDNLKDSRKRLRATVATLRDSKLEEPVDKSGTSVYVVLHGIVQHDLYHAGQIAILKGPRVTIQRRASFSIMRTTSAAGTS